MRTFFTVWIGQLVSIIGSGLTQFGLAIWVFTETGSVTSLASVIIAGAVPAIIVGTFAGAVVDRVDRRRLMIGADTVTGLGAAALAALFFMDTVQLWHILLVAGVSSTANAFQEPAWLASVPLLVPKKQLSRANGMTQANQALGLVLTPVLAGVLVGTVGIGAILAIDFATFLIAISTLLVIRIPKPKPSGAKPEKSSLWTETWDGLTYLRKRRGLLLFLFVAAILNFLLGFTNVLTFPLVLSFASEAVLGTVMSVVGVAMLIGSIVASAWSGARQKMRFILGAMAIAGVFLAMVGGMESAVWVGVFMAAFVIFVPVINATSQTLWQSKVALDYQGRVFATRRVIATIANPVAYLLAGPLADRVFEPLMAEDGRLAESIGQLIGTGPGRGIALMFMLMGLGIVVTSLLGFLIKPLRNVEADLPDVLPDEAPAEA